MVRKSSHGGVAYPVHVQKCVRPLSDVNGKQTPFCENNSCRVYMEVAWRSGMNAVECQHIREVGVNTTYKEEVHLRESDREHFVLVIILYIIDVYMRSQVILPAGPSRLTSDQHEFRPE